MNRIDEEKEVVGLMIDMWHKGRHGGPLCKECAALKAYSRQRLDNCPFAEDKPSCKQCPVHCYEPEMRERIREVMRYSGPRMMLYHPIIALRHALHELRYKRSGRPQAG